MKILKWCKDGGPESHVHAFVLIEIKCLFSIMLLKFEDGSREAFHNHAFNAISWLLHGRLDEYMQTTMRVFRYDPSWRPIFTSRRTFHKVVSMGTSYALTFRGPWRRYWREYIPAKKRFLTLTHGRTVVNPYE